MTTYWIIVITNGHEGHVEVTSNGALARQRTQTDPSVTQLRRLEVEDDILPDRMNLAQLIACSDLVQSNH